MKTKTLSLKLFQPAMLAALALAITCGLSVSAAQAGYIVTLQQVGPDVVATGSGAIDLSGLIFIGSDFGGNTIGPDNALILIGADGFFDDYAGFNVITGPTSFGTGANPTSGGIGDHVGINGLEQLLFVPQNYVSGHPLSSRSTWPFQTLDSLLVIPGTYIWTWGTGPNQSFTLQIGGAGVADSGSTFGLLLVAASGLFGVSRLSSRLSA
jgi:hypothetical protein